MLGEFLNLVLGCTEARATGSQGRGRSPRVSVFSPAMKRAAKKKHYNELNIDRMNELGYTDDPSEAGYITPDGKLLDLSGKSEGGSPGMRSYDHREAGGWEGMQQMMGLGFIRFGPESNVFHMKVEPTQRQYETIRWIAERVYGEVIVEAHREPIRYSEPGKYDLPENKAYYKEYDRGTRPDRIINDIKRYYSGEMPQSTWSFEESVTSLLVERTLYHGTITDNEESIRKYGLVGGWQGPLGGFVNHVYGDEEYGEPTEDDEIVFLTDKDDLGKAVGAMVFHIGQKLGKDLHDVSDNDVRNFGLLVVVKDRETQTDRGEEDPYRQLPRGVEPGDYFASQVGADYFLKGSALLRFLRRQGEWPRDWGVGNERSARLNKAEKVRKELKKRPLLSKEDVLGSFEEEQM